MKWLKHNKHINILLKHKEGLWKLHRTLMQEWTDSKEVPSDPAFLHIATHSSWYPCFIQLGRGGWKTRWCQYGHQSRCCKTTESSYLMKVVNFTIIIVVVRYKLVTRAQNLDESIWTQLKIWLEEGVVNIHLLVGNI